MVTLGVVWLSAQIYWYRKKNLPMNQQETTQLLKELVAIPSPYFEEHEIMTFTKDWLCSRGLDAFIHQYHEDKVTDFHGENVVVELDGGQDGPVICLNGHLDSVQLCNGWTKNPLGEQDGDRLYGQGALDMKSGCAAIMVALDHFHKNHPTFQGKIKASFVSVEEGPYGMGTNALIEDGYLDDVTFSLIAEPSAGFTGNPFPDVCLGARGGYGLTIEFYGKSAHAASPELGRNAAVDAAKVVAQLEQVHYVNDPNLGKGTCCVIAMNADGGACSVPDIATVKLFWHIVVGETPETIEREIHAAVKRAGIQCDYAIKFRDAPSEGSRGFLPYTVPKENPMVEKFLHSVSQVTGKDPSLSYFQSIGDFCYLGTRLKGAPALIFGAAGANFHGEDEYVSLDSVHQTAQVLYDFLEKTLIHD